VTQGSQTRTFEYDTLSRLRTATNPESGTITYQYDDSGNLLVKTDAREVSTHFEYDGINRVTRRWYNGSSSVAQTTHNNPALPPNVGATNEVRFYYDTQPLPSGAPAYTRGSAVGRLVAQVYGSGSNGDYYAYDVLGRQTLKYQQMGTINYQVSASYSLSGATATLTYPSGHTVTHTYDNAGRLTALSGNLGDGTTRTYTTGVLYSPLGGLVKEQFGTNTPVYNKLFYNSRGQLAEIRESTSYTGPTDTTWNRGAIINHYSDQCWGMCSGASMTDNNGNLQKQEVYIPNDDQVSGYTQRWQQYGYDSLNRLSWAREIKDNAEQWKQQFTYDRWGNRTIDTGVTYGVAINNKAFTVDAAQNRLGVPSGQSGVMAYDAAGNLTNDTYTGAGNRTYDAENKITSAWGGNNQAQLYAYDATGQRIKRTVNGDETWQVYGFGGELLAEYPVNGAAASPQKEYGYRNGQLLITAEPPTTSGMNVALAANGATASASSTMSSSYPASNVINGERAGANSTTGGVFNGWISSSATMPQWVQVDFGQTRTINEIDLFMVQDNYTNPATPTQTMTFTLYGVTSFDVQYWTGSAWTTIPGGSVSGNNKVWRKFSFTAITTTKIRVLTNASVDGYSRLTEVEAWSNTTPPPLNAALTANGATASASSTMSNYPASNVINGERAGANSTTGGVFNGWISNTATMPQWLQVDFGQTRTISEIDVFMVQDNYTNPATPTETMTFTLYGLSGFEVQYWTGSAWTTIPGGSVSGNNKVWRKFSFTPIATTKIRVLSNASVDGYSRLTEVEAWANGGAAGPVNWLVTDQLGTPRMVLDQTGALAAMKRHDYLPFGEELFVPTSGRTAAQGYTSDGVRQQFTQKERDFETGLDYFLARYYSSTQGRFTSVDPFNLPLDTQEAAESNPERARRLFNAYLSQPQQWNRYSYGINNPLLYVDPTGEAIQLSNDKDERERQMQALREAVGSEAAQYLYVNQGTNPDGSANYYVGIYDSNPSTGDQRSFEQVNEVAGEFGAIIRDTQVVKLEFVGSGTVVDDYGDSTYIGRASSSGAASPAATGYFKGQLTIKMLDWSKKDLGYLPGAVMSDRKDNMLTPSVMQGHELGHARARMTGYRDRRGNREAIDGSLRLENKIRKLQFPNGPTRERH